MNGNHLTSRATAFGSFSVAFFAVVPTINMILARIGSMGDEALLTPLYALSLFFIGVSVVLCRQYTKKPGLLFVIVFVSVLMFFFLSQTFRVRTTLSPVFFWLYTVISFVIPQLVIPDVKKTLQYMMIMPAFGFFFLSKVFQLRDSGAIGMDLTYSFLVPIIATIVYLFFYLKEDKHSIRIFMYFIVGINLIYFLYCLLWGSRAPALSVFLCIVFLLCVKISPNKLGFKLKKSFMVWGLLVLVFVVYFVDILYLISGILKNMNLDSYSIDKMINLYELDNLSDGREEITKYSWIGISDSPIWGHGISASERFTYHTYPHNFLLQLLLDGGVVLFLLVMMPMVIRIVQMKKTSTFNENVLVFTLFFASVPGAIFSLDLWANSRFWLFMGFLLSVTFSNYYKKQFRKIRSDNV